MGLNLRPIAPAELPAVWPFVRKGLEEVIRQTDEKWTPVHVQQGINDGWAYLFVDDDMFVVLQILKEEWTSQRYLHVWVMWARPLSANRCKREAFVWLDGAAERLGVGRGNWKFGSPRYGWGARRLEEDIEVERVIWRRKK